MTVSVIIPVKNRAALLPATLHSLLGQSHPPDEILVVDDASSDASAAVAETLGGSRTRVLRRGHSGGPSVARNDAARIAASDLLVFLDSDDLLAPGTMERHVNWLGTHPEDDAIYGCQLVFRSDPPASLAPPTSPPVFHPGAFTVRRLSFLKVGWLDEKLLAGEWIDWYSRAQAARLRFAAERELCLLRREHPGNHSKDVAVNTASFHRMLSAHLRRIRQAPEDSAVQTGSGQSS